MTRVRPADVSPRRERNAPETRRRLLDAGEAEFAAKGFAGARLRDVARVAGVQQALIHHYFVDKDGLYRAVLERAIAETTEGSWNILGSVSGVVPTLEAFVDMLVRFYASHANLLAILRSEAASASSVAVGIMRERMHPVLEAVEAMIARWQADGLIRADLPPSEIIVAIMAMTIYPYQEAPLLDALWPNRKDSMETRKRTVLEMALRGAVTR